MALWHRWATLISKNRKKKTLYLLVYKWSQTSNIVPMKSKKCIKRKSGYHPIQSSPFVQWYTTSRAPVCLKCSSSSIKEEHQASSMIHDGSFPQCQNGYFSCNLIFGNRKKSETRVRWVAMENPVAIAPSVYFLLCSWPNVPPSVLAPAGPSIVRTAV